jgi:hypothetical protein
VASSEAANQREKVSAHLLVTAEAVNACLLKQGLPEALPHW